MRGRRRSWSTCARGARPSVAAGARGGRAAGYDQGEGRRNWRALDLGTVMCFLQSDSPRVNCPEHGPTVAQVPWARHGCGHTRDFDDQVAWLVTHTAKSAVCELMRVAWRTVGSIVSRVVAQGRAAHDPFDGLVRIGIDEISYKRGHRYLTVVVDHDSGRLIWAAVGRGQDDPARVLRPARRPALRQPASGQCRWCPVDRRRARRTSHQRHPVHRQFSCMSMGLGGAGHGPARGVGTRRERQA